HIMRTVIRTDENRRPVITRIAVTHQFHQLATSMHGRLTPCVVRLANCLFKGGLAGGALRCLLLLCNLSLASAVRQLHHMKHHHAALHAALRHHLPTLRA
ncbi:hypothetical protein, partial [Escherichia coli]|uniref:hypothetical protein n=1 Tax=Escherichia coli TaxID=562 RepID=UPI001BC84CAA